MNPRFLLSYRFSTTPTNIPTSPIGPNSPFQKQLRSMFSNCKPEMQAYSQCVSIDGIQTQQKQCEKQFQLLKDCIKRHK